MHNRKLKGKGYTPCNELRALDASTRPEFKRAQGYEDCREAVSTDHICIYQETVPEEARHVRAEC